MSAKSPIRIQAVCLAFLAGLSWSFASMAALDIPNMPLFLTSVGVKPNLVMTIDDSASMMSAYLPESWYVGYGCTPNCLYGVKYADTNRFKSSYFNVMYYNPSVTYKIPTRSDGVTYSTSFTSAKENGFDSSSTTVNLAAHYRAQVDYTNGTGRDNRADSSDQAAYYYQFYTQAGEPRPTYCTSTVASQKNDDDCYVRITVGSTSGPSGSDERQNFAVWYSFYRTRALATMSAAMQSMGQVELDSLRFAWQTLNCTNSYTNCCNTFSATACKATDRVSRDNRIRMFDSAHSTDFFGWLEHTAPPSSAGTPLRAALQRVGEYYRTTGVNSPYAEDPQVSDGTEYSCRRNFHLMMTDGVWNGSLSGGPGDADSNTLAMPDGLYTYTARHPYDDNNSNSLADLAFHYWATDLRNGGSDDNAPDCTGATCNKVSSNIVDQSGDDTTKYWNAKNDPASWQHMTNFMVGLGLGASLTNPLWAGSTYDGDYIGLVSGSKTWPYINTSTDDPDKVYDLWHAAIDSRGEFFSADSPESLNSAFQDILDTISSIAAAGGGAGLSSNTTQIDQVGASIYEAKFNADWSGQLLARPVQSNYDLGVAYWDAGQRIPAPHARNIFTTNGSAETFSSCSGDLATALNHDGAGNVDGLCSKRLNWLRGDGKVTGATWASFDSATNTVTATFQVTGHGFVPGDSVTISDVTVSEDPAPALGYNGTFVIDTVPDANTFTVKAASSAAGLGTYASDGRARYSEFRNRANSVLGDIMNSDPVYTSDEDLGYGGGTVTLDGKNEYTSFVTDKAARPPMIYVGANDGMLHGFRADTGDANSGVELLAYVPQAVYGNLSKLTDSGYTHTYYVDGPIGLGDAYISGAWGTYLAGSLGAGGKSVFVLDISDPSAFSVDDVKWEFSDSADLGLTYSKPQIAPTSQTDWVVIFGNGYNSASGKASLYIVDVADATQFSRIPTDNETDNGLSTPYLYDRDGDKIPDVAYAGDLQGNVWKFVNSAGTWTLGNGGLPLFTARNDESDVQRITSQPKVATHPNGGVLVYFGTGSYLTTDDLTNDDTQTFYAVWDKGDGVTGTVERTDLQPHQIETTTTLEGYTVRTTSNDTVDWSTQRGWYLDLPSALGVPSERIVSTPLVMEFTSATVPDRILFVTNTPYSDPCDRGGSTWLMELDLITGSRTATSVYDLNGDSTFDTGDMLDTDFDNTGDTAVSGIALPSSFGLTGEPLLLKSNTGDIVKEFSGSTGASGPAGGPLQRGEAPSSSTPPERIYWQQIQ